MLDPIFERLPDINKVFLILTDPDGIFVVNVRGIKIYLVASFSSFYERVRDPNFCYAPYTNVY